jgi:hypothetical protein
MKLIKSARGVTNREAGAYAPMDAGHTQASFERDFEVVLHVGHPKTATTWVQDNIFGNPRSGFIVPWTQTRARAIAAFVTVNPYWQKAQWARSLFAEELESLADDPRVPVISDETLCGDPFQRRYNGRDVADRIYRAFPRAKVLIGIREQKSMAISAFREYIALGGTLTLKDFIGVGDEPISFTPILREDFLAYHYVVDYYQRLYGSENVLVLPIEQLQRDRAGYVQTLRRFCGCPGEFNTNAGPNRVGWSAITLAARRMLNPLVPVSPLSLGGRQMPTRIANRLCGAIDHMPRRWGAAIERRWKDQVARRYAGTFRESNRRLAELTDLDLAALGYDLG